jgi:hypothetical protein
VVFPIGFGDGFVAARSAAPHSMDLAASAAGITEEPLDLLGEPLGDAHLEGESAAALAVALFGADIACSPGPVSPYGNNGLLHRSELTPSLPVMLVLLLAAKQRLNGLFCLPSASYWFSAANLREAARMSALGSQVAVGAPTT